uniref:Uncharacterized protein n=1 Tax=Nymphaea colorata TaxID=210225 RepID=A0A5K1CMZ1_9MAGN
MMGGEMVA